VSDQISKQNTTPKDNAPLPKPKPSAPRSGNRYGIWLLAILLIASVAYFQYRLELQIQQNAQLQQTISGVSQQYQQQRDDIAQQQSKLDAREQALQSMQAELAFMRQTVDKIPGARLNDWKLAEVEYLLRLANQRVQLQHEPQAARGLFQAADEILAQLDDPALMVVREHIADAMFNLGKRNQLDVDGLYVKLQALKNNIPETVNPPTEFAQQNNNASKQDNLDPTQTQTEKSLWQTLYGLVQVRHKDTLFDAPLTQQQRQLLAHSLNLMLQQAQWALVKRDNTLYQTSLENATSWVDEHVRHQNTAQFLNTLQDLKNYDVSLNLPDVSRALISLRQILQDRTYLPEPAKEPTEEETQAEESA